MYLPVLAQRLGFRHHVVDGEAELLHTRRARGVGSTRCRRAARVRGRRHHALRTAPRRPWWRAGLEDVLEAQELAKQSVVATAK